MRSLQGIFSRKEQRDMTNEQKTVLRKIIYAVETGGQVYGQQDYSDFTEAYTNSSDEHAITIGQERGTEPKPKHFWNEFTMPTRSSGRR